MRLPLLLALGATFSAAAAPSTPTAWVAPFKGKTGPSVRAQVAERVCAAAACVEKARAAKAAFTVQGNVTGDKKKYRVTLEVTPAGKKRPTWRKTWGVTSDGKGLSDPDQALSGLLGAMGLEGGSGLRAPEATASPAARPAEPAEKRRERTFAPLDLGGGEAAQDVPTATGTPAASAAAPAPAAPVSAGLAAAPRAHAPWVELQVGTDVLTRQFGYTDLQIVNLRGFRAPAIVMPSVQGQVRPFASGSGWLSRLRLEGGFATSVGLRAGISSRTVTYPASAMRVDGGLRVDLLGTPGASGPGLEAFAGYRSQSFSVGKATDGSELENLAAPTYGALRAGVTGRWGFGRVSAFAEGAALPLLGTGDLQATYFPRTSGFGLEGMLGADVALMPWLGLRLAAQATHYGTTFATGPSDPFIARGASDLYAGATVALRAAF